MNDPDTAELIRRVSSPVGRGPRPLPPAYSEFAEGNWEKLVPLIVALNRTLYASDPRFYRDRMMTPEQARQYEMHARLTAPEFPYQPSKLEARFTFEVAMDGATPPGSDAEIESALVDMIHAEVADHVAEIEATGVRVQFYLIAAMPHGVKLDLRTFEPVLEIYMAYQPA